MRIPIVNEQDEIIKVIDINDRRSGEICRVSALWIVNEKDEILLAQRGLNKKRDPGKWGPAVAGTVEEGETYEDNIIKEAEEEIGLKDFKFTIGPKNRNSSSHEYFGQYFLATVDSNYPFKKRDEEVEQVKWFSQSEIKELYSKDPDFFVPSFFRNMERFIK